MAKKETWVAPPDPDFDYMARAGWEAWRRDQPSTITFDTETSGVNWFDDLFCVQVSWRTQDKMENHYFEYSDKYRHSESMLKAILRNASILVGHNIKFDIHKVVRAGLLTYPLAFSKELHDTEALAHLDDEHRPKGLKPLAVSVLGYDDTIEVEVKSGPNKGAIRLVPKEKHELDFVRRKMKLKKDDGFHVLPRAILVPYALKDTEFTLQLYEKLRPRIEMHSDLWELYLQEMELTKVFIDMEAHGMGVDLAYVNQMVKDYQNRVLAKEMAMEGIVAMPIGKGKTEFNPNSNPQIAAFFESQGIVSDSYDEEHLRDIDHPLAKALGELRKDQKILNTYFRALQKGTEVEVRPDYRQVEVFHPSVRQHGTVTGRTSSGGAKGDNG